MSIIVIMTHKGHITKVSINSHSLHHLYRVLRRWKYGHYTGKIPVFVVPKTYLGTWELRYRDQNIHEMGKNMAMELIKCSFYDWCLQQQFPITRRSGAKCQVSRVTGPGSQWSLSSQQQIRRHLLRSCQLWTLLLFTSIYSSRWF